MGRFNPNKHRLPPFETDGLLLVDKPAEWTSFDVVNCLRGRFNIPKLGHCGTLDPAATGLLVLVLGKFTKYSQSLSGADKTYEATLLLGTETDSQDMDGNITATQDTTHLSEATVRSAIERFVGKIQQLPPMVSAVKKNGKKLYELARQGIEVEREPREIEIYSIEIRRMSLPECDLTVHCSKGTYIRTLCADIGKALGVGGILKSLRRTQSGTFQLSDATSLDDLKNMEPEALQNLVLQTLQKQCSAYAETIASKEL